MATQEFVNLGPIYTTEDKYNTLKSAGQLEAGREYRLIDVEPHNAYTNINQVADYLFETQYSSENIDYDYANTYFQNITSDEASEMFGGCTGIYKDGKVLRQFDYYYDNNVEFVVRRPADPEATNYVTSGKGIHASIGMAAGIKDLTKENVESGSYNKKYKLVPFDMTDGINDAGLYIQVNVVPITYRNPSTGAEVDVSYNLNPSATKKCAAPMVIRYILDHCSTFADVDYFFNHTNIYATNALKFGFHYLIVIGNVWKIYELTSENVIVVTEGTGENQMPQGIMTNFRTFGLTFTDGVIDWASIEGYGLGVERYNIAKTAFDSTMPVSLNTLRQSLKYTHLYTDDPQTWATELCGDTVPEESGHKLTVQDVNAGTYSAKVTTMLADEATKYSTATRDVNNGVWTTTHSAIYDIASKSFIVNIQERFDTAYRFEFDKDIASDVVIFKGSAEIIGQSTWGDVTTTATEADIVDAINSGKEVIFQLTNIADGLVRDCSLVEYTIDIDGRLSTCEFTAVADQYTYEVSYSVTAYVFKTQYVENRPIGSHEKFGMFKVDNETILENTGVIYAKEMLGAGSDTDGAKGIVPQPHTGDNVKFLRGDGSWADIKTYLPFPNGTITGSLQDVVTAILAFPSTSQGMAYLGEIEGTCVSSIGLGNVECSVTFMKDGLAVLHINSADTYPYCWEYNTASGNYTWKPYNLLPNINSLEADTTYFLQVKDGTYSWSKFKVEDVTVGE